MSARFSGTILSLDELNFAVQCAPDDQFGRVATIRLYMAFYIFNKFLGQEWCDNHIFNSQDGFLSFDFSEDEKRERTAVRLFELAENMFNLQIIGGFEECLDRLLTSRDKYKQLKSTFAEIEFGRILQLYSIKFRYLRAQQTRNPDLELTYPDGTMVVADAKCKIEGSVFSTNSITNSLKDSRSQFDPKGAGALFIKVPQYWTEVPLNRFAMKTVAENFLRSTGRVALVCYYSEHLTFDPVNIRRRYAFLDVPNPNGRRHPGRDLSLLSKLAVSRETVQNHEWIDLHEEARSIYAERKKR